jgi:hypothetical protein
MADTKPGRARRWETFEITIEAASLVTRPGEQAGQAGELVPA